MSQNLRNNNIKKEIFSELRDVFYHKDIEKSFLNPIDNNEIRISILKNKYIIEELKALKIIELDNFESFTSFLNYDHYLLFKFKNDYYFCDTEYASFLKSNGLIKLIDFPKYLRRDKILNIAKNNQ